MAKAANQNEVKRGFRCAVSADLFRRAMAAMSTEETRYYLNGVFVQPCAKGGAILTSTNGHWLISIHDPRGIVEGVGIVRLDATMKRNLKEQRGDALGPHGMMTERCIVVGYGENPADAQAFVVLSGRRHTPKNAVQEIEPRGEVFGVLNKPDRTVVAAQFRDAVIDGTYPDWTRVVTKDVDWTAPVPPIDHAYVALAAKALSEERNRAAVRLVAKKDDPVSGPVTVLPALGHRYDWSGFAVVMPMRAEHAPSVPDYWHADDADKPLAA